MRDLRRLVGIAVASLVVSGALGLLVVRPDDAHIELRELSPIGAAGLVVVLVLAIVAVAVDSTYGMASHPRLQPAARALCAVLIGMAAVVALYATATVFP